MTEHEKNDLILRQRLEIARLHKELDECKKEFGKKPKLGDKEKQPRTATATINLGD